MSMDQRLIALAEELGADIRAARLARGDLSALPTTAKDNLVAAIIEVRQIALDAAGGEGGAVIDDNSTTDAAWSAARILGEIEVAKQAVKDSILGGASAAYDTLMELEQLATSNESAGAALATAVANRVRFDAEQTLTGAQKLQACQNIGIGDPETDLVAVYNAAKA